MKQLAWAVVALLAMAPAIAIQAPSNSPSGDFDTVLRSFAARTHGQASFVEQHFVSMLNRPVVSSGELIYDAPDRLEKRTLEPRPETLSVVGHVLTVTRGHRTHVLDLGSYPQALPFVESIRATLAGDGAALAKTFRCEFSGDADRWTLLLTPLDPALAKIAQSITLNGMHANLLNVEIRQADGDRSLMTLRNFQEP